MENEKISKNLEDILDLLKGLGLSANVNPSIRFNNNIAKPPKMPSAAPANQKNAIKQAQQLADPNSKKFAVNQAQQQTAAKQNQFAFKSENGNLVYAYNGTERLNDEPLTQEEAIRKFGKEARLVPVVEEELVVNKSGQWSLTQK